MAINILLMMLFSLNNVQFGETGEFVVFARNSSLDNHICPATEVVLTTTCLDSSHCLWKCWLNSACISAFYNENTAKCVGCSAAYFQTDGLSAYIGGIYYELRNKAYGKTCYAHDRCIGENGTCWDGRCQCVIGYPYDFKSKACVQTCASYGSTYQEYTKHLLYSHDIMIRTPVTLGECQQLCSDTSWCLGCDYVQSVSQCYMSNTSSLTNPESLMSYETGDLYVRNCEE